MIFCHSCLEKFSRQPQQTLTGGNNMFCCHLNVKIRILVRILPPSRTVALPTEEGKEETFVVVERLDWGLPSPSAWRFRPFPPPGPARDPFRSALPCFPIKRSCSPARELLAGFRLKAFVQSCQFGSLRSCCAVIPSRGWAPFPSAALPCPPSSPARSPGLLLTILRWWRRPESSGSCIGGGLLVLWLSRSSPSPASQPACPRAALRRDASSPGSDKAASLSRSRKLIAGFDELGETRRWACLPISGRPTGGFLFTSRCLFSSAIRPAASSSSSIKSLSKLRNCRPRSKSKQEAIAGNL